jgi:hypothetical protein
MDKAIIAVTGLAVALGACATANTPQQELAYARWATCAVPYTQIEQVDVDGRITFQATSGSTQQAVVQCLADAGRNGPALPEPLVVRPVGGGQ